MRLEAPWKQEAQCAVCVWMVRLLLAVSRRGELFRYVPDHYLHTLVGGHAATTKRSWSLKPQS